MGLWMSFLLKAPQKVDLISGLVPCLVGTIAFEPMARENKSWSRAAEGKVYLMEAHKQREGFIEPRTSFRDISLDTPAPHSRPSKGFITFQSHHRLPLNPLLQGVWENTPPNYSSCLLQLLIWPRTTMRSTFETNRKLNTG